MKTTATTKLRRLNQTSFIKNSILKHEPSEMMCGREPNEDQVEKTEKNI